MPLGVLAIVPVLTAKEVVSEAMEMSAGSVAIVSVGIVVHEIDMPIGMFSTRPTIQGAPSDL